MNFLFTIKEKVISIFRSKRKGGRRWKRELYELNVTYITTGKDLLSGRADVLDISKGGVRLALDHSVQTGEMLCVKLNPYSVQKHVAKNAVALDNHGRYMTKVVWVRGSEMGKGCTAGCAFLRRAEQKDEKKAS